MGVLETMAAAVGGSGQKNMQQMMTPETNYEF